MPKKEGPEYEYNNHGHGEAVAKQNTQTYNSGRRNPMILCSSTTPKSTRSEPTPAI